MTVPRWKRFERDIAKRFRRWFPDARRGMQFQDDDYAPDVVGKDLPFYVECKTGNKYLQADGKSFNPDDIDKLRALLDLYQCRAHLWHTENNGPDLPPIIVYKRPRELIRVIMYGSVYNELAGPTVKDDDVSDLWWGGDFETLMDVTYAKEGRDAQD